MSFAKKIGKTTAWLLAYLIAFDILGVVASFFLDVTPIRGRSAAAFYAIWFVLGVFCGMLGFNKACESISPKGEGDWSTREDSGRTGLLVIAVMAVILTALAAVFYRLQWQGGMEGDYFVPDSEPLSITFFVAMLGSAIIANTFLRPSSKKS